MRIEVQQNTEEWLNQRIGLVTGSQQSKVMANYGKAFGNPAHKYAVEKAVERLTLVRQGSSFTNEYMERGTELEPIAVQLYEAETMYKVEPGGFFVKGTLGDSPDGIVGRGCIEVKVQVPHIHLDCIEKDRPTTGYKWQLISHMYVGDREWCDFVSYCPEMPVNKRLWIKRIYPDEEMIEMFVKRNQEFEELINEKMEIIKR